jgi:hypothetical protein
MVKMARKIISNQNKKLRGRMMTQELLNITSRHRV